MYAAQAKDGGNQRTNQADGDKKHKIGNINPPGYIVSHGSNDQALPQLADIADNSRNAKNHQEYNPDLTPQPKFLGSRSSIIFCSA